MRWHHSIPLWLGWEQGYTGTVVSMEAAFIFHVCYSGCVAIVMEAVVLFDYEKQQDDELDLAVGMTIQNVIQVRPL